MDTGNNNTFRIIQGGKFIMILNALLKEKYKVQKKFSLKAKNDLKKYFADTHADIKVIEEKYTVKFNYSSPLHDISK